MRSRMRDKATGDAVHTPEGTSAPAEQRTDGMRREVEERQKRRIWTSKGC